MHRAYLPGISVAYLLLLRSQVLTPVVNQEFYFLGYNAVWFGENQPTFRKNMSLHLEVALDSC
jgi:hypothetical protein